MMDNSIIRELLKLNSNNCKRLLVNDNCICEFDIPSASKVANDQYFFTEFYKEQNCPRQSCYANVIAYKRSASEKYFGKLYIHYDMDINAYSMSLVVDDGLQRKTLTNVVTCKILV